MSRNGSGFIKGIGTGLAVGAVVAAMGSSMMKNKKSLKRNAGKAIRAVGDIMDNVQYMMK